MVSILLLSVPGFSFPEMIRHGYTSCVICHTSVAGGNLLNEYGRSLSKELLSQPTLFGKKANESDEQFLAGTVPLPEWMRLGGDVRLLQTFVENSQVSKGRFLIMQVQVDADAKINNYISAFASMGRIESSKADASAKDFIYFPQWGLQARLSAEDQSNQWSARVGRFLPVYGIHFAEHTFVTRTHLDFGPGQERFGAELALVHEDYSLVVTGITGLAAGLQNAIEEGGIIDAGMTIGRKSKIGINYYQTKRALGELRYDRKVAGLYSMIGFTDHWYGLFEVDQPESISGKKGLLTTMKVGHDVFQGCQIFGTQEFSNLNTEKSDPKFEAYGIGVQWFPRPHWDMSGVYRREKNTAVGQTFSDVIWLIGHYYL